MDLSLVKRQYSYYLCLWLLLVLPSQRVLAAETITITNGEWPPYLSDQLQHSGFVSHIVSDAFKLKSVNVNYKFRPWKRAFEEARNGTAHGSVVWSKTKEREQDFLFSDPVIIGKSVLFHLKDKKVDWNRPEDLAKYKIGGTLGYKYSFEHLSNIVIERVTSDELNFRKLLWKRIDLFPSDKDAGYVILNKHFTQQEITQITYHPLPYDQTSYSLMLSKKHPNSKHLLALFNAGLKELKASGKYSQIISAQESGKYKELYVSTGSH